MPSADNPPSASITTPPAALVNVQVPGSNAESFAAASALALCCESLEASSLSASLAESDEVAASVEVAAAAERPSTAAATSSAETSGETRPCTASSLVACEEALDESAEPADSTESAGSADLTESAAPTRPADEAPAAPSKPEDSATLAAKATCRLPAPPAQSPEGPHTSAAETATQHIFFKRIFLIM